MTAAASIDDMLEAALERVLERRLRPIEDALARIGHAAPDDLLTLAEASRATGYSQRTLRLKAAKGRLPGFKPEGSSEWRFRRAELLRALACPAGVDLEAEARKIAGRR